MFLYNSFGCTTHTHHTTLLILYRHQLRQDRQPLDSFDFKELAMLTKQVRSHSVPETGLGFKKYTIDELLGIELDMS